MAAVGTHECSAVDPLRRIRRLWLVEFMVQFTTRLRAQTGALPQGSSAAVCLMGVPPFAASDVSIAVSPVGHRGRPCRGNAGREKPADDGRVQVGVLLRLRHAVVCFAGSGRGGAGTLMLL